jgi:inositol phosphorylceramide synthase catalytic subunit
MNEFSVVSTTKLPFHQRILANISRFNPIPVRYRFPNRRRKHNPGPTTKKDDITALKTSFNIRETVDLLRQRKWKLIDAQYLVMAILVLSSLCISPPAFILKTIAVIGALALLAMPATGQFFFPALPIWTWLVYFFSSRYVGTTVNKH